MTASASASCSSTFAAQSACARHAYASGMYKIYLVNIMAVNTYDVHTIICSVVDLHVIPLIPYVFSIWHRTKSARERRARHAN